MIKKNLFILVIQTPQYTQRTRRPFKGRIDYFHLESFFRRRTSTKEIYKNLPMGVLEQFEGYTTPHCLEGVYDVDIYISQND